MKENPRMIVASGTRDARVFLRLKMSKHTNMTTINATERRTASSLATAEPTSYSKILLLLYVFQIANSTHFKTRYQGFTLSVNSLHGFPHFPFADVTISIFIE